MSDQHEEQRIRRRQMEQLHYNRSLRLQEARLQRASRRPPTYMESIGVDDDASGPEEVARIQWQQRNPPPTSAQWEDPVMTAYSEWHISRHNRALLAIGEFF